MQVIGTAQAKIDGMALVTGKPVYTSDLELNSQYLTVKVLRSPHASARIRAIETSEALSLPGVACVLTHLDVPQTRFTLAGQSFPEPSPYDRLILDCVVRYVGDAVAVVAATDEKTALLALEKIQVEYELSPPLLDPATAIGSNHQVHQQQPETQLEIGTDARYNIAGAYTTQEGDVEAELARCEVVIEQTYTTQAQAHAMLETHRCTTCFDGNGRLQVTTSTQIPFHVRRHLARALGLSSSRINVIKPRVGGGFGGKQSVCAELFPALVTLKTGQPARIVFSREETFASSTSRHAMQFNLRLGADRTGHIQVIDIYCLSDTGSYGEHAYTVLAAVSHKTLPLYNRLKAYRYHGHAVYTNKTPGGALRGYGATQGTFALESAINELAQQLSMDPAALRLKNLIKEGESHSALAGSTAQAPVRLTSSSLQACIARGKELIGWEKNYPRVVLNEQRVRGYGMAVTMQGSGIAGIDTASVMMKLNEDGCFTLSHAAADIGQGSDTVLAQIAAEVLEVEMEQIVVRSQDLDALPYDTGAYASSGTHVTGKATQLAAEDMRRQLFKTAAQRLQVKPEDISYSQGIFSSPDGRSSTLAELAQSLCTFSGKGLLIAKGVYGGTTSPPPFIAGFAEVEVDLETGEFRLTDYVAVVDCGTVLNRNLARLQVEGGLAMGIGLGLFEEVRYSKQGRLNTSSFMDYKIPCRLDIPKLRVEFIPSFEPSGPFGAKSIGEIGCNTPCPAIAQAIANATGVVCRHLPITAEKILLAMQGPQ